MSRNSSSAMFAAIFIASSVFGAAFGKTLGAPPRASSSAVLNGPAGAHLLKEDDFLLLEDEFDETASSLSESFLVDEGDVASSDAAAALLAALSKKQTGLEGPASRATVLNLSSILNLMTLCVVLSGCYRLYVERLATNSEDSSASANEFDVSDSDTSMNFDKMAEVIREDRAEKLAEMLTCSRKLAQAQDSYGCTALHLAAHAGATACLRLLMAQGAVDVDAKDAWEETPLHFAARHGSVAACELLLFHGAALNALNSGDEAPLMSAGKAGHAEVCDFLLARGAIVGDCDDVAIPHVLSAAMFCRLVNSQ